MQEIFANFCILEIQSLTAVEIFENYLRAGNIRNFVNFNKNFQHANICCFTIVKSQCSTKGWTGGFRRVFSAQDLNVALHIMSIKYLYVPLKATF